MEDISIVFTIFFMLLGPLKLIPLFAGLTKGTELAFKRSVAVRSALVASAVVAFVAVAGGALLSKYRISIDALRLAGGVVLLLAAVQSMFRKSHAADSGPTKPTAMQLAASPMAVPGIVPPAGVAAILIFMMLAPENPGMARAVAIGLAFMMALDFLVMFFIDQVMKIPGLMIAITVLGSVLAFIQAALAIQIMLLALTHLGAFQA